MYYSIESNLLSKQILDRAESLISAILSNDRLEPFFYSLILDFPIVAKSFQSLVSAS